MEARRWVNPTQPQTLQIAVFLLYANAVYVLLLGNLNDLLGVLWIIGSVTAGFGIANERRWGYALGLVVAFLPFVIRIWAYGPLGVFRTDPVSLVFQIAMVALLLHNQSREYQKIWFK